MADVICAWCHKKLGEIDGDGTSHGICRACAEVLEDEMEGSDAPTEAGHDEPRGDGVDQTRQADVQARRM